MGGCGVGPVEAQTAPQLGPGVVTPTGHTGPGADRTAPAPRQVGSGA